jgi:hypothetical protein
MSHRLAELFVARPGVAERADQISRAVNQAVATAREVSEPVRRRLEAPLIRPQRFESVKDYRTWKRHRSACPPKWNALQWPLGIWLGIGAVLALWVKSLLS